ncbi:hypothetical protein ACFTXM_42975 [Streptomyces sp. NPDC056930]|uniref:hypothetical protein n=1 Tax=Streptomyces sp. NPDC056930 TaxID=3345967 RepID=UPI00363025A3
MSDTTSMQMRQIPARVATVGPGWVPLLVWLHADLTALAADYQLEGLGAEFGRLRLQVVDQYDLEGEFDGEFADAAAALVDAAVLASQKTCEDCGAQGRPRFRGDQLRTWIHTLCYRCRADRTVPDTSLQVTAADFVPGDEQ